MKISKKLKKAIDEAIGNAFFETLSQSKYKSLLDNAPDTWEEYEREIFDLLSELQHNTMVGIDGAVGCTNGNIQQQVRAD